MKRAVFPIAALSVFGFFLLALEPASARFGILQQWSNQTLDFFYRVRRASSGAPPECANVVWVTVDEESCDQLGLRWPWPRQVMAGLVRQLAARKARVVALNFSFSGLEAGDPKSTEDLAEASREHGRVVAGSTFIQEGRRVSGPVAPMGEAIFGHGFLEKIVDPDQTIRRAYLARPYRESSQEGGDAFVRFETSFPLQVMAATANQALPEALRHAGGELSGLRVGSRTVFTEMDGSWTINYRCLPADFRRLAAWRVVRGKFSEADVSGKIVLVGLSSDVFGDVHATPLGRMAGIGIHANEIVAMQSGRLPRYVPSGFVVGLAGFAGACVIALCFLQRFWTGLAGAFILALGLYFGAQIAFSRDHILDPFLLMAGPFFGVISGSLFGSLRLFVEKEGLERRVIHDDLTGLYTYAHFRRSLERECRRAHRARSPFSVVMVDMDRFKSINDTLGHEVGNDMIRRASAVIRECARRGDIVARYGGDEFVVLLCSANRAEAESFRERLRGLYESMAKKLDGLLGQSTLSVGIATCDPADGRGQAAASENLIREADQDLFRDKQRGAARETKPGS